MLKCEKCGADMEDGSKFCPECGAPVPEAPAAPEPPQEPPIEESEEQPAAEQTVFCPQCGAKNGPDSLFCEACGASLKDVETVFEPRPVIPTGGNMLQSLATVQVAYKGKKLSVKMIAIAVAVVIVIGTVIAINPFGAGSNPPVFYIKDQELNCVFPNRKPEPTEVTSNLGSDQLSGSTVTLTEDGKRVFYPDKISGSGFSLYYKNVNSKKDDAEKVDSDIGRYSLLQGGAMLVYQKADNSLYLNDLKDKTKIDSDVNLFLVDDTTKEILYQTTDKALYIRGIGLKDEKEKIADSADWFGTGADFSKVYYMTEGSLYVKETGKDKKKITSDVDSVLKVEKDGTVYYMKKNEKTVNLMDYVNDDMAEKDAAITEPDSSNYSVTTQDAWGYTYQTTDWDSYNAAMNEYNEKLNRDQLRDSLKNQTIDLGSYTLCCYNGTSSSNVAENVSESVCNSYVSSALVYKKYEDKNVDKVSLSQTDSLNTLQESVQNSHVASDEVYLAVGGKETQLKQDKAVGFMMLGESLYFVDSPSSSDQTGALMKVSLKDKKAGSPEKIDDEVYGVVPYSDDSNGVLYMKDLSNGSYELYRNKEKIASDVMGFYSDKEGKNLYLMTDYNTQNSMGTLVHWANGKTEKVSDDVHDFSVLKDGNPVYIYDYSSQKGDLMLKSGSGDPKKLDEDVTSLVSSDFRYEVNN